MGQKELREHILSLSRSAVFEAACQEWELFNIYLTEEWDNCPCGQEIKEHCEILNRSTGAETFVGNICINRFVDLGTTQIFAGLKRIQNDPEANANEALISYAETRGFLYEKEPEFLRQTAHKRNLSGKQLAWKEKINRRIVERIVVRRLRDVPVHPAALIRPSEPSSVPVHPAALIRPK